MRIFHNSALKIIGTILKTMKSQFCFLEILVSVLFNMINCQSSLNVAPVEINTVKRRPIELNVTKSPIWGSENFNIRSVLACPHCNSHECSIHDYKISKVFVRVVGNHEEDNEKVTISQIFPQITLLTAVLIGVLLLVSVIIFALTAFILYRRRKRNASTIKSEEIKTFYNGSDKPSASVEDTILNLAIRDEFKILPKNFTYGTKRMLHLFVL